MNVSFPFKKKKKSSIGYVPYSLRSFRNIKNPKNPITVFPYQQNPQLSNERTFEEHQECICTQTDT